MLLGRSRGVQDRTPLTSLHKKPSFPRKRESRRAIGTLFLWTLAGACPRPDRGREGRKDETCQRTGTKHSAVPGSLTTVSKFAVLLPCALKNKAFLYRLKKSCTGCCTNFNLDFGLFSAGQGLLRQGHLPPLLLRPQYTPPDCG